MAFSFSAVVMQMLCFSVYLSLPPSQLISLKDSIQNLVSLVILLFLIMLSESSFLCSLLEWLLLPFYFFLGGGCVCYLSHYKPFDDFYICLVFLFRTGKKQEWCFACELEILVKKVKGNYSPISPSRIISQIQCIGRHLGDGKEEDAHEFLR